MAAAIIHPENIRTVHSQHWTLLEMLDVFSLCAVAE
jgi:hypothetical protein